MNRPLHSLLLLVLALLVASACDSATIPLNDQEGPSSLERGATATTATPKAASRSTVPVLPFGAVDNVGTSRLTRTDEGVSFQLSTTNLEPATVHTLWMIIFNQPDNCVGDCGDDDLSNTSAKPDAVYAAGTIIGESGRASYGGHRSVGDNSGSILPAWLGLPAPGLTDPFGAEIHFVVHSHGPMIPALVDEMLHTFNAGCGPIFDEDLPPVPESLGTRGPNTCEDVQFAVHSP